MKKILSFLLAIVMAVGLTACGTDKPAEGNTTPVGGIEENNGEANQPQTAKPVIYTMNDIPVPEAMKEYPADISEEYATYVNRNLKPEVVSDYEETLKSMGFTVEVTSEDDHLHQSVAKHGNAEILIFYEHYEPTAEQMADPEFRADGGMGLDRSVFEIQIFITEAKEDTSDLESELANYILPVDGYEWNKRFDTDKFSYTWYCHCDGPTRDDMLGYVALLKDSGWNSDVSEYPEGEFEGFSYGFSAYNRENDTFITVRIRAKDNLAQAELSRRK